MKSILAPTDFSPLAANAARYAIDMARVINASVTLVHVCRMPLSYSELPVPPDVYDNMIEGAEKNINDLKEELVKYGENKVIVYTIVETGDVVSVLQDYCDRFKPYAVVMSTHGAGNIERALFGSTTLAAIRNLSYPLMVIPRGMKFKVIRHVGLACDFNSSIKNLPLEEISALVKELGAHLHILHVKSESGHHHYTKTESRQYARLRELFPGNKPSFHFLEKVDIVKGISDFADRHDLDMLIVIPKKHSLVSKLFHRSQSGQMALHAQVPVMSVHE